MRSISTAILCVFAMYFASPVAAAIDPRDTTASAIQDNSFLVEEAYNQEARVVQHIFTLQPDFFGGDERAWQFAFTQEWPLFSQAHQLSYTIPVNYFEADGDSAGGIGDLQLNYRWQAVMESPTLPALAPRFTLILPSGDEDRGLGDGSLGYELALPASKIVSDRITLHGNIGLTYQPDVDDENLTSYFLGASTIYAVNRNFNFMLEWIGEWPEVADDGGTDHQFVSFLSPGARYAINIGEAQLVLGMAVPVGLTDDSPDWGLFFYLSFEHGFGH